MGAAAPVALVHSACICNLLKSSFANCIASPAGAPAIWPFPFAVWYAVSAAAAISSGARAVKRRFLIQQQRRRLLSIYQRKEHYLIQRQHLYEQALYTEEETEICAMRLHIRICTKHQDIIPSTLYEVRTGHTM
ncbi:uncharacterized protein LOC119273557 [Triticum dicoccoides]|uniref:uncharacterized protein LOC119273557 n=1 Tax=Triticum dicoccoides TaxID=85692 RepID=UPI00188F3D65|nr:uncharacterized protein LOC119273557 [Triticum dicoccoides]XP_044329411.1 uncharacterized protein LOC123050725 [Triticum aestivum]